MKSRTFILIVISVFLCIHASGFSQESKEQEEEGKRYFLNLSLFYPISINKTKHDTVNLNLSVASRVGYVHGFDLSLIGSAITHGLKGVQICGLSSIVGESGKGAQASGLMNVAGDSFTGFQATGLLNISGKDFQGFQAAGLLNIVGAKGEGFQAAGFANISGESYSGIQTSGVFNITGEKFTGLQTSGLFNIVGERLKGAQAAGLFNVTGDVLTGLQAACFNIAGLSKGIQVGIANVAGTSNGVQIGLVNYTKEENTGVPIGPVNLASNGRIRGICWGGNFVAVTAGVKFMINRLYSITSIGFVNLDDDINESITYGFHYGISFLLGHLTLNTDVGYRFRDNKSLFRRSDEEPDQHILEARLALGIPVSEGFSLILGTGLNRVFDWEKHIDTGKTSPLA